MIGGGRGILLGSCPGCLESDLLKYFIFGRMDPSTTYMYGNPIPYEDRYLETEDVNFGTT